MKIHAEDDIQLDKLILVNTSILIIIAALIWGFIYIAFGETKSGLIPLSYAVLSTLSFLILKKKNGFPVYRFIQIFLILLLPFLLMMSLGGFINGSVVIIWSLLAPIGAMLSGQLRQARYWFFAFIFLIIISGFLQPFLRSYNSLPDKVNSLFFVINIVAVSLITFLVLNYFLKNKNKVIELIHKNRELEVAKLEQEVLLRQNDKLTLLGKLSAGIAHELNNPAAVALHGSRNLQKTLKNFEADIYLLGKLNLNKEQESAYSSFRQLITVRSEKQSRLDALTRSDYEEKMESWLEIHNIENSSQLASMLVELDFSTDDLTPLQKFFSDEQFSAIISSLHTIYLSESLLVEIGKGAERITEIIKSLKSYSYQEEAPVQMLDIHQGLNDTLIMMRSQLKNNIDVRLKYDENLPLIAARGSELIQVWTNIIDNAITAMDKKGKIVIKTFREDDWVVIRISDTGQGIPEGVQAKIFDPFFTTKLPGEGTGLGLNISYDIIVNRHKGKINVYSKPGETCFEIKLPVNNNSLKEQ